MNASSRSAESAFHLHLPPTPTSPFSARHPVSAHPALIPTTASRGFACLAARGLPVTPPDSPMASNNDAGLLGYPIAERHLLSLGIHEAILIMLRRMGVPVPEPVGYEPPSPHPPSTATHTISSNTLVSSQESGHDGISLFWPPASSQLAPELSRTHTLMTSHEPGMTLTEAWPSMTAQQKQFVREQLASIFREVRSIRPSPDHVWLPYSFPVLPLRDRFWLRQTTNQPLHEFDPRNPEFRQRYGPFSSHESFVDALVERIAAVASFALDEEEEAEVIDVVMHLKRSRGGDFVFTHGNFCADNVIVGPDGRVLALLDWSQAGFYPRYWEWVKAKLAARQHGEECDNAFVSEGGLDVIEPGVSWEDELWSVEAGFDVIW